MTGAIEIEKVKTPTCQACFVWHVMFVPAKTSWFQLLPRRVCHSEECLKTMLLDLGISPDVAAKTICESNSNKNSSISNVSIVESKLKQYGLVWTVLESLRAYASAL